MEVCSPGISIIGWLMIFVLVNEFTISHAEFLAMLFGSLENSVVVGSKTAGANGDVAKFLLPGNVSTTIFIIILTVRKLSDRALKSITISNQQPMVFEEIKMRLKKKRSNY